MPNDAPYRSRPPPYSPTSAIFRTRHLNGTDITKPQPSSAAPRAGPRPADCREGPATPRRPIYRGRPRRAPRGMSDRLTRRWKEMRAWMIRPRGIDGWTVPRRVRNPAGPSLSCFTPNPTHRSRTPIPANGVVALSMNAAGSTSKVPEHPYQIVFGDGVPQADAGKDIVESAPGDLVMVRDGDVVIARRHGLPEPYVTAASPDDLVAYLGHHLDDISTAHHR